jgi:hypothetical protein
LSSSKAIWARWALKIVSVLSIWEYREDVKDR